MTQSQTKGQENASGNGSTGNSSSSSGGTPTKTIEELMRDQESMRKSIQDLTRIKEQNETLLKQREDELVYYQSLGNNNNASSGENDGEWLTGDKARQLFREELTSWQKQQQEDFRKQQDQVQAFQSRRNFWIEKANKDFPDSKDQNSPFFKKAVEIFNDPNEGLTQTVNGQVVPLETNADYVAFARAKAQIESTSISASETRAAASFASSGASSSSSPTTSGEISDDDFLKMTDEEQAKYQEEQFKRKHGG